MRQRRTQSWPECPTTLSFSDNDTQTDNITCDHEEENNHRVLNELKVLSQHLLDYNRRTFEKFMHDIEKKYRDQVTANKKMRYKIEDLKMQVKKAEKELAFMKSNSIHQ